MLVFSDCTDKEHTSGKRISFLMVLDLFSCNETVVKILYPWVFKVAVLYILLCDIRTRAFINLIAKRKKKRGTGEKGQWLVVIDLFSSAQFNRELLVIIVFTSLCFPALINLLSLLFFKENFVFIQILCPVFLMSRKTWLLLKYKVMPMHCSH